MRKMILGFAVAIMLMAAPASAQRPVISGYQETVQAGEELHLTAGCVDCVVPDGAVMEVWRGSKSRSERLRRGQMER